jgi:hypothetical protein
MLWSLHKDAFFRAQVNLEQTKAPDLRWIVALHRVHPLLRQFSINLALQSLLPNDADSGSIQSTPSKKVPARRWNRREKI